LLLTTVLLCAIACCSNAVDRYLLLAGPTAANPPHVAAAVGIDGIDIQMDGHRTVT